LTWVDELSDRLEEMQLAWFICNTRPLVI
jgi:hypothetical protein